MLFVLIIVESRRWGYSVLGVFFKVLTDSRRRHLQWGFCLNKVLRRNSGTGVFFSLFCGFAGFWKHLPWRARTTVSLLFWDRYYYLYVGPRVYKVVFLTRYVLLLLFASDDIKYFDLKSKQTQKFFYFFSLAACYFLWLCLQKIISWSNQISIKVNTN